MIKLTAVLLIVGAATPSVGEPEAHFTGCIVEQEIRVASKDAYGSSFVLSNGVSEIQLTLGRLHLEVGNRPSIIPSTEGRHYWRDLSELLQTAAADRRVISVEHNENGHVSKLRVLWHSHCEHQ